MNLSLKPFYDEFAGHLYRLFNATVDQFHNVHLETYGKSLDEGLENFANDPFQIYAQVG